MPHTKGPIQLRIVRDLLLPLFRISHSEGPIQLRVVRDLLLPLFRMQHTEGPAGFLFYILKKFSWLLSGVSPRTPAFANASMTEGCTFLRSISSREIKGPASRALA